MCVRVCVCVSDRERQREMARLAMLAAVVVVGMVAGGHAGFVVLDQTLTTGSDHAYLKVLLGLRVVVVVWHEEKGGEKGWRRSPLTGTATAGASERRHRGRGQRGGEHGRPRGDAGVGGPDHPSAAPGAALHGAPLGGSRHRGAMFGRGGRCWPPTMATPQRF